jgi:hypothetical protein
MIPDRLKSLVRRSIWIQQLIQEINLFRLRSFQALPDDIYIVTYPRSGTTLAQMMLYQILSDGNMDFPHIKQISPWWEMNPLPPQKLASLPKPRIFKTHLHPARAHHCRGRLLYVVRDGRDVALSYYHLYRGYFDFQGTFAAFFNLFMDGKVFYGSWFNHVLSWRKEAASGSRPMLFLKYEDVLADSRSSILQVAEFVGVRLTEDALDRVVDRCSLAFMKQHESKFGPKKPPQNSAKDDSQSFIRKGQKGDWQDVFTEEMQKCFLQKLQSTLPGLY